MCFLSGSYLATDTKLIRRVKNMRTKYMFFSIFVLFTFMLVVSSYADLDPNTVVGFWSFEDGGGKTVKDGSKNKFDGAVVGTPTSVAGKVGKALEFNGTTDYIDVPGVTTPQTITFACWFKKLGKGGGGVPRLFTRGAAPWSLEFGFGITVITNQLGFYMAFEDGSSTGWTAVFEPKDATWYHTAITFDGTSVKAYIDGKSVLSKNDWAGKKINKGPARIGGGAGADDFQGDIDEPVIFNVALSETDINNLMAGKLTPVEPFDKIASTWGNIKNQ
jgi:hypothetical protein